MFKLKPNYDAVPSGLSQGCAPQIKLDSIGEINNDVLKILFSDQ